MITKNIKRITISKVVKQRIFESLTKERFVNPLRKYSSSAGYNLPVTVNLRAIFSNPNALKLISKQFDRIIKKNKIEEVAGFEVSGIPLSTAVSLNSGISSFTLRKEKHDHGMLSAIAGHIPDKKTKIAIVDDGFASGKSMKKSYRNLKKEGYTNVKDYFYLLTTETLFSKPIVKWIRKNRLNVYYILTYEEYVDWAVKKGYLSKFAGWAAKDCMANQTSWKINKLKWNKFNWAKGKGEIWVKYPD